MKNGLKRFLEKLKTKAAYPRMDVLCLICRQRGHIASSKCLEKPLESELNWFMSDTRKSLRFDDMSDATHPLCRRCKDLEVLAWLRTEPPIQNDRDLGKRRDDPRLFRTLGYVGSIELYYDCPLCRCLYGLIAMPSSLEQRVILVLSWSMYRL